MRLDYCRFGDGNSNNVIILHGLLGSKRNWFAFSRELASYGFNVWLFDQRNHGRSEWSDRHTYFDLSEDIRTFISEHNLKKIFVIGHLIACGMWV